MPENDLNTLWEKAWSLLLRGQADAKHPFATPVVATVTSEGSPRSRTLVLRKTNRQTAKLWCYTDRRSGKADDLSQGSPIMSWTFWAKGPGVQVNCSGPTDWLPEEIAKERFRSLPKHSRKSYATLSAPGQPQATATDGLPADWEDRSETATAYAAEHFGILCTTITHMEVLQLDRAGQRRMLAQREVDGEWRLTWLVP
jgi:pyridoxine/pyridoxamine 5'-phosphate oxidase